MTAWAGALAGIQVTCRDTFGVPVTYDPSFNVRPELTGMSYQIVGILDGKNQITQLGAMDVSTFVATLDIILADLDVPPLEGDTVTITGETYRINEIILDGLGSASLILITISSP